MAKPALLPCSICGRETDFFTDPLGPFCSDRCKLADLGKWLGEEYCVSESLRPDHFAEFEQEDGEDLDRPISPS